MRMLSTKAEYDAALTETAQRGKLLVIDFTATWCGPCQKIAPVFEALASEFPQATFAKVDVDENQETAQVCGVSAMPTFKGYKDKREIFSIRGADEASLRAAVATHAGSKFEGQGQRLGSGAAADGMSEREKRLAALEKRGLGGGGAPPPTSGGNTATVSPAGSYMDQTDHAAPTNAVPAPPTYAAEKAQLNAMGFSDDTANQVALEGANGDVQRALELLLG